MKIVFQLILLFAALLITAELISQIKQVSTGGNIVPLEVRKVELPIKTDEKLGALPEIPPQKTPSPPPAKPTPKPASKPVPKPEAPTPAERPEITLKIALPTLAPTASGTPKIADQEFYDRFSTAVIQIFCRTEQSIFSASGIIVNERGLVLTNVHVVEIIKKAGEANCVARHGNPADTFSKIQIIYEADAATKIPGTEVPKQDFAFLKLIDPTAPFTSAPIDLTVVERGTTVFTLGYPSEFLQSIAASSNSSLVFSTLRIDDYGDIDGNLETAEAYISHGGIVLQQGSSGTALFARSGKVVGIIFATTKGATTADREGIALMTSYIDSILRLGTGQGLMDFITSH